MRKAVCVLAMLVVGVGLAFAQEAAPTVGAGKKHLGAPETPKLTRVWCDAASRRQEDLLKQLREEPLKEEMLLVETPLCDVLAAIQRDYGVVVHVDTLALDELGLSDMDPVSLRASKGMPLGVMLPLLLDPLELVLTAKQGELFVTTHEDEWMRLSTAVYPVSDLLLEGDSNSLIEVITSSVAADTWAVNGGGEAEIRFYPQRGALVVTQTFSVHEEIADLLAALRQIPVDPRAKVNPEPQPVVGGFGGGGGGGFSTGEGGGGGGGFGFGSGTFVVPQE